MKKRLVGSITFSCFGMLHSLEIVCLAPITRKTRIEACLGNPQDPGMYLLGGQPIILRRGDNAQYRLANTNPADNPLCSVNAEFPLTVQIFSKKPQQIRIIPHIHPRTKE